MRAALDHLARDLDVRKLRVVAAFFTPPARILRNATSLLGVVGFVLRSVPVGGPLPDIADHVVDAVAVRPERTHRRRALVTVLVEVLAGKFTLPRIGHVHAAGREIIAPGVFGAVEPAA